MLPPAPNSSRSPDSLSDLEEEADAKEVIANQNSCLPSTDPTGSSFQGSFPKTKLLKMVGD